MQYFKYWIKEPFRIRINGTWKEITLLCGSNTSKEDARNKAASQAQTIEDRVKNRGKKEVYEVAIKEHVHEFIDSDTIITICRYGAKILNTTRYTILDLDDAPFTLFDLFGRRRKMSTKEKIVYKFERNIQKFPELGTDFRIYETAKGIRVIGKHYVVPSGKQYTTMMRKLLVDWVYIELSKKQNCYRARLTPKPYRIKAATIKITSPLDCETSAYHRWAEQYTTAAQQYSVVKLLKTIGSDFSQEPVIKVHDQHCLEGLRDKLA